MDHTGHFLCRALENGRNNPKTDVIEPVQELIRNLNSGMPVYECYELRRQDFAFLFCPIGALVLLQRDEVVVL